MDSSGFWNVRGLNSPNKHGNLRCLLNQHSLGLFDVLETIVRASNFPKFFPKVYASWSVQKLSISYRRENLAYLDSFLV